MTKGISVRDAVNKIDNVLLISVGENTDYPLSLKAFKKIMMVEPEAPIITSERTCRERYRTFQELGIVNDTGRINVELFTKILKGEAII
jgi:hypothetical protein